MKITIYTITDCTFSQTEKQYLQSKNIAFEEKNLELNREYLTEMLNISNNFAGTPVTKIEKDDGQVIVLKGFTQEEFEKALSADSAAPVQPPAQTPAPAEKAPEAPKGETPPVVAPQPAVEPAPVSQPSPAYTSEPEPTPASIIPPPAQETPAVPAMPTPVEPAPVAPQQSATPPQPVAQEPQQPAEVAQPSTPQQEQALSSVLQNLQARVDNDGQQ